MVKYSEYFNERLGEDISGKEEWREFFKNAHGDIEDGKVKFLFVSDEEGFEAEAEDIEVITDEPPNATFQ